MKFLKLSSALTLILATATACSDGEVQPLAPVAEAPALQSGAGSVTPADQSSTRYVLRARGGRIPANLAAQLTAAGATLERTLPQIGVAFVRSDQDLSALSLTGIEAIVADRSFALASEPRTVELSFQGNPSQEVASIGDSEPFYFLQWGPGAIQAPEAWNAGYRGSGVRVAVLDGGLFSAHPDLAANVDVARSASFVPGLPFNADVGTFWHGTHVAGIIGAAANGLGVIGIAPSSTLIGVKVLHGGGGDFSWLLEGIIHAATPISEGGAGAQVINMSLGAIIPSGHGNEDPELKAAVRELVAMIDAATTWAWNRGVTVVASAGNDAINFDESRDLLHIPSANARVISVAATGPFGWAYGNSDFGRKASYTNSGKREVGLAAPGGDFAWPTNELCNVVNPPGTVLVQNACWIFDMYLSTSRGTGAAGSYSWSAGTSMASPVVAAVAALIIEKAGGRISPALVEQRLQQGALDLGKPGRDEVYGRGWVNAYRSILR